MFVHSLDRSDGPVTDEVGMLDIATDFYKKLFRKDEPVGCHLSGNFFSPAEKLLRSKTSFWKLLSWKRRVKKLSLTPMRMGLLALTASPFFFIITFGTQLKVTS